MRHFREIIALIVSHKKMAATFLACSQVAQCDGLGDKALVAGPRSNAVAGSIPNSMIILAV